MTENEDAPIIVGVTFPYSTSVYDFLSRIPVSVGDVVKVNTRRGTAKVTVVEIKESSDVAEQFVIEIVPPEPEEPKVPEVEDE